MAIISAMLPFGLDVRAEGMKPLKSLAPAPAPEITLVDGQGESHLLSEFKGSPVLLHFWATWCVPCVKELPQVADIHKKYKNNGLKVMAVAFEQDSEKVASFLEKQKISGLTFYLDKKGEGIRAYQARGLPASFLINKAGQVVASAPGPVEWTGAEAAKQLGGLVK